MDKHSQRQIALQARNALDQPDRLSQIICETLFAQTWYQFAQTVLCYVSCRSEVRTLACINDALLTGKRLVVPYCIKLNGENHLGLFLLKDLKELQPGMRGILEPPVHLRDHPARQISAEELDIVLVPGVAFDTQGGRLGYGAGYYDRLLKRVRPDCVLAALSFQAQLLPTIIMQAHDVFMDYVITETTIYPGLRFYQP